MQPMADTYRCVQRRYIILTSAFASWWQANGWHGWAARHSRVRIPVTDLFQAQSTNTNLKLCRKADCTICGRNTLTRIEGLSPDRDNTALTTGNAGENSCYTGFASSGTDMQFKTSNLIDSTVLSWNKFDHWCWCFVEFILLLWNIVLYYKLFVCKASRVLVNSIFLAKQSIFIIFINLHASCIPKIVQ